MFSHKNLLLLLWLALFSSTVLAGKPPAAAIATAHPLATEAGFEILAAGGNAFDATVAVSAALAVVEPYSSGIGGGGFWLLHRARDGHETMVDGRERAPLAAHRDLYLDDEGEVIPGLSMDGALAAGIPGEPAALAHISKRYGRLSLKKALQPAIRFARNGFPVTKHYRRMTSFRLEALRKSPAASRIFLNDGEVPAIGHLIKQPELANTLQAMAERGADGFYLGTVAEKLIQGVTRAGGIWSRKDLSDYRIVERQPIRGSYRGMEIISAPPPSSGGIALVTMLNILENFELEHMSDAARIHLIVEAMRRAYRDRAEYLGDSDFVAVPVSLLTHPYYAAGLASSIRLDRATRSDDLPGFTTREGGNDTTHFSILDGEGNYVAATLSINYPFGSGFVPEGTGVLLNDEMDDFSSKPGTANAYGLVGAEANAIAPGKRMLSSMTPTFVRSDHQIAVLGTPGGSRIITMVLLGILELAEERSVQQWVSRPRFHHQYLPDTLFLEPGALDEEEQLQLEAMGHHIKQNSDRWGNMHAIHWNIKAHRVGAASDPRVEGLAEVRK